MSFAKRIEALMYEDGKGIEVSMDGFHFSGDGWVITPDGKHTLAKLLFNPGIPYPLVLACANSL